MAFDAGRLRTGELIAGGGGILLFVAMFWLPWFGIGVVGGSIASKLAVPASLDGWDSLTVARWILLITIVLSLGLVVATATRRSPAVPVSLSVLTTAFGALASVLVLHRIIDHPGVAASTAPVVAKAGIYLGLVGALAVTYGGYRSMRAERSPFGDPATIETVSVSRTGAGAADRSGPSLAGESGTSSAERTAEADRSGPSLAGESGTSSAERTGSSSARCTGT